MAEDSSGAAEAAPAPSAPASSASSGSSGLGNINGRQTFVAVAGIALIWTVYWTSQQRKSVSGVLFKQPAQFLKPGPDQTKPPTQQGSPPGVWKGGADGPGPFAPQPGPGFTNLYPAALGLHSQAT